jgi:mutator protein MutT
MKTIDVAVVILVDGRRMLVNKRPEGAYYAGWWEWPGGKRHDGESFEQCARRELLEELGLEVEDLQEYARTQAKYPGRMVNLVFFTGRVKPGSSPAPGALEHCWLAAGEIRRLNFLRGNLDILRRLERELE